MEQLKILKKHAFLIIRLGLAAVFFANAYTAWFMPDELKEILEHSYLSELWPFGLSNLITIIGLSDTIVTILLIVGKWLKFVAAYAFTWIVGVILISQPTGLPDIFEHIGFLAMALYIWINNIQIKN